MALILISARLVVLTLRPRTLFLAVPQSVTSNDDFAVSVNIADADVPIPAHTHVVVHDNASVNAAANDVTSNNSNSSLRGTLEQTFQVVTMT